MSMFVEVELSPREVAWAVRDDADKAMVVIEAIDDQQCTVEFTRMVYDYAKRVLEENGVDPEEKEGE